MHARVIKETYQSSFMTDTFIGRNQKLMMVCRNGCGSSGRIVVRYVLICLVMIFDYMEVGD